MTKIKIKRQIDQWNNAQRTTYASINLKLMVCVKNAATIFCVL